jgi:hypothetical protein
MPTMMGREGSVLERLPIAWPDIPIPPQPEPEISRLKALREHIRDWAIDVVWWLQLLGGTVRWRLRTLRERVRELQHILRAPQRGNPDED